MTVAVGPKLVTIRKFGPRKLHKTNEWFAFYLLHYKLYRGQMSEFPAAVRFKTLPKKWIYCVRAHCICIFLRAFRLQLSENAHVFKLRCQTKTWCNWCQKYCEKNRKKSASSAQLPYMLEAWLKKKQASCYQTSL